MSGSVPPMRLLRYARPLAQAAVGSHVDVADMRVHVPGSRRIRLSVVAGNIRIHRLMDGLVRQGGTVVDVGANIGYNTVYAAHLVGPAGRVIAIEPAEDNLAVLTRNVAAGRLVNVTVRREAAGRSNEVRDFFLRGSVSAVNSLFPDSCYAAVSAVTRVPVAPLDDLVEGDADLVKIDVEGAELDVLAGMPRLLEAPGVRLIVEWHPVLQRAAGYRPDALPHALFDRGFSLRAASHTSVRPLAKKDIPTLAERLQRGKRPIELVAHR